MKDDFKNWIQCSLPSEEGNSCYMRGGEQTDMELVNFKDMSTMLTHLNCEYRNRRELFQFVAGATMQHGVSWLRRFASYGNLEKTGIP